MTASGNFFQLIAKTAFEWTYAAVSQLFERFGAVNIILTFAALIIIILISRVIHKHKIK